MTRWEEDGDAKRDLWDGGTIIIISWRSFSLAHYRVFRKVLSYGRVRERGKRLGVPFSGRVISENSSKASLSGNCIKSSAQDLKILEKIKHFPFRSPLRRSTAVSANRINLTKYLLISLLIRSTAKLQSLHRRSWRSLSIQISSPVPEL